MNRKRLLDNFWLYFFISIAIFLLTTLIRYQSRVLDLWLTHVIYLILVIVFIKVSKQASKVLKAFVIGLASILFLALAIDGFSLVFGLNIISYFLAIINGYYFTRLNSTLKKVIIIIISIFYCSACELVLADLILHYENHGNFTGHVDKRIDTRLSYVNEVNDTININSLKDKIIVLDFWSTSCGICYQQFPVFELIHKKYKNNHGVIVTSINVPIKRDSVTSALNEIRNRKYTFDVGKPCNKLDSVLGVFAFPVSIIIVNNHIIYRGDINGVEKAIEESLKTYKINNSRWGNAIKSDMTKTKIIFDKYNHNFGDIVNGAIAEYAFRFKNVGDNPLIIKSVRSSCGCTIANFSRMPIKSNESGVIDIQFNSKNRIGQNRKDIYVFSNADTNCVIKLSFSVNVVDAI